MRDPDTICCVGSGALSGERLGPLIDRQPVLRLHDWPGGAGPAAAGERCDWSLAPPWEPEKVRRETRHQPAQGWILYYLPHGLGRRGPAPYPDTAAFQAHSCPPRPSRELMQVQAAVDVLGARRVLCAGMDWLLDADAEPAQGVSRDPAAERAALKAFAELRGVNVERLAPAGEAAEPVGATAARRHRSSRARALAGASQATGFMAEAGEPEGGE